MKTVLVRPALRERLQERASDELVDMFAEAHTAAAESFERHLVEETGKIRLDMSKLQVELLKWSFVFWIGQVAAVAAILSWVLGRGR
jgi:hypothetical protein